MRQQSDEIHRGQNPVLHLTVLIALPLAANVPETDRSTKPESISLLSFLLALLSSPARLVLNFIIHKIYNIPVTHL